MIIYTPPAPATHVPIIDFSGASSDDPAERDRVAREIHIACRTIGFFYIVNHGVSQEMVARAFDVAMEFFDLPSMRRTRFTCAIHPASRVMSRLRRKCSTVRMQPRTRPRRI